MPKQLTFDEPRQLDLLSSFGRPVTRTTADENDESPRADARFGRKCIDCGGDTADDDPCCEFEESRRMGWCGSRFVPVPGCSCFVCVPEEEARGG